MAISSGRRAAATVRVCVAALVAAAVGAGVRHDELLIAAAIAFGGGVVALAARCSGVHVRSLASRARGVATGGAVAAAGL